ncbi:DUF4349 domain-containing protein [Butyrivibrio sp. YAB3001]|uniref:DUF4349 domain-containing protein n=1 Tax=Butyrivibrio sp. YAB3001 TaxID=1520812 RepID=UPI0008F64E63|nr:DUF4349 domain-containing protein [Butyrivibrio sp. YAB3001]SFB69232.1 protein of unknown function [Butyrivibrio sp. YAB3001]
MKKRLGILITTAILAVSFVASGCGSAGSSSKYESATEFAAEESYETYGSDSLYDNSAPMLEESKAVEAPEETQVSDNSRKLITTLNISAETEDLDEVLSNVQAKVKELGGYIESSNIYNGSRYSGKVIKRDASLTIRIPAQNLDSFVETVTDDTNITNKSTSVEDVTLKYVDIESRKNALKAEEKRLLEIVDSAETVEDIITVENRLSEVRYEIESIESQLRTYDNKVNYSTVYLDLTEVKEYTPVAEKGPFQRMGEGFISSVRSVADAILEFFVWLVIHIPQIILLIIAAVIIVLVVKRISASAKKKRIQRMQQVNMYQQMPYGGVQNPQQMTAEQTYNGNTAGNNQSGNTQ